VNREKKRSKSDVPEKSATLSVKIQPRSSRNDIVFSDGGEIRIRLTAPPVDGAANAALIKLLSDRLSVPKSAISILSGETSRNKILKISGLSTPEMESLLNIRDK
jgi:uncharacterized protein